MGLMKNPYVYSKMDKEDREELIHRRAQFLIYKILERADSGSRQQKRTTLLVRKRVFWIRLRIGKRLKRLRKSVMVHVRVAKDGVCKNLLGHIKSWRRLFGSSRRNVSALPLFALQV